MKYEYKTVHTDALNYNDATQKVCEILNDLSASGWEYIDNITSGRYAYAILVFRREKT